MAVDTTVPRLDFRVLGPVEVLLSSTPVPVPAGAQRTLLAMLLLGAGHAMTVDRLAEGLWGEEQPQDPRASLHTAVARLRRTLGPAGNVLRTLAPGYALDIPAHALDSHRFTELHAQGRSLLGDAQRPGPNPTVASQAAQLLSSALTLWRGPAWGEFADGVASGDARRLEEARLAALEDLASALVTTGQPGEAVAVLEPLVAENPLRDRAVGLLVDALHRYGRTADALGVLASYRQRLADDLGLDPSPVLTALHERVLRQQLPEQPIRPASSPRSTEAPPHPGRSRLVGREKQTVDVTALLGTGQLVSLVGPGGVGKTSLALEVAERTGRPFAWVDLAPVRDQGGVLNVVAEALGVEAQSDARLPGTVRERLRSGPELVVLDNCEHVLDGVAQLLPPDVSRSATVLATSRERLGVTGEQVVTVDPLRAPEAGAADPEAPAVALFLARAREAGADLATTGDTVRRVGDVCRALDGLPLALELGAARMGTLTLDDLADRLDRRFDLLTRGARTAPARHRTLRAVVDWSYELLDEEERTVFTRLAVFPSGFGLDAAEAVAGGDGVPPSRVADAVAGLAERSMVVRPRGPGRGTYRLLETLRQYAVSRLAPTELAAARRRHVAWALSVAERARDGLEGPDEERWADQLDDVLPDLRAAWRWSREADDPHTAERLVAATWRWAHWRLRTDVLGWGAELLARRPAGAPVVAYTAAAGRAWVVGDLAEAERLAARAVEDHPEESARADVWEMLGDVHLARSAVRQALEAYGRAEQIHRQHGDRVSQAVGLSNKVLALTYSGLDTSRAVDRAIGAASATGNPTALAFARYAEAEACADGDERRAAAALEEAIRLAETVGNRLITGISMTALVALRGRAGAADTDTFDLFRRVIAHWATTRSPTLLVTALRNLVILLGRAGRDDAAVELGAALRGIAAEHPSYGLEAERLEGALATARTRLGAGFDDPARRGRSCTGFDAVAALAERICGAVEVPGRNRDVETEGRASSHQASTRLPEPRSASHTASPDARQSSPATSAPNGPPTAGAL